MMPKDFQEKVLDACAVAWDGTSEAGAGELYENVRIQIKNLAKARREMQGPKPMEVDRMANSRADWSEDWDGGWRDMEEVTSKDDDHDHNHEEANIQNIEKGGGKKGGKGFQGYFFVCGGFGHSQWDCHKGKVKGVSARTVGMAKVMARMDPQASGTAREMEAMARAACRRLALGVGLRSNVQNKEGALEE